MQRKGIADLPLPNSLLQSNSDLWIEFYEEVLGHGDMFSIVRVKAHATSIQIWSGFVSVRDLKGNSAADASANMGRRTERCRRASRCRTCSFRFGPQRSEHGCPSDVRTKLLVSYWHGAIEDRNKFFMIVSIACQMAIFVNRVFYFITNKLAHQGLLIVITHDPY